jgi:BlaI family transcriptional regulator, penicillinase repressor
MRKPAVATPTIAELETLAVLWPRGPSTVKDVHETPQRNKPTLYTTVLKLLQIMGEKGLVERDEKQRAHIYRPAIASSRTQEKLVTDLMDRAFAGSAAQLCRRGRHRQRNCKKFARLCSYC